MLLAISTTGLHHQKRFCWYNSTLLCNIAHFSLLFLKKHESDTLVDKVMALFGPRENFEDLDLESYSSVSHL
jgi:hypothetical protein